MAADSDRLTHAEVAKLYGTSVRNVKRMAVAGQIPYHRIEDFVRADGSCGQRYVFLRSIIDADLRRAGELAAEKRGVA